MALVDKSLVFRLVPDIGAAILLPRLWRHLVVGHHAKRRGDVLPAILVLIGAPHPDTIGVELVEDPTGVAKSCEQALTMPPGGRRPRIVAVFLPHRLRPTLGMAEHLGDARIVEGALQDAPHVFVRP